MQIFWDIAPIKIRRVKKEIKPEWLTENIIKAQRNRDTFHNKKDWTNFKYWRNKTKNLIRASKKNLFANVISDKKDNKYSYSLQ